MTSEEIIRALEANLHLQMIYFVRHAPNIDLIEKYDVTAVRSNIFDNTFNYIVSARFTPSNAAERVKQVIRLYSKPSVPFSWWLGPMDTPKELGKILISQGLTFKEENVGMFMELNCNAPLSVHPELCIQQVLSQERLKDFAKLITRAGGSPSTYKKIYSKVPSNLYCEGACLEMYTAYLRDSPISTGMLVFHAGVAGLYYVATDPQHRRKGYGTAMMNFLLQKAISKGYRLATLQATREGKGLYERLGFKECCIVNEYGSHAEG